MSKSTPGPWRIGALASWDGYTGQPFRNVWAGDGEASTVVARAIRAEGRMDNDVDADALLIAAAPELLEALQGLLERISVCYPLHSVDADAKSAAMNKALAAIAKATGEAQ